MPTRTKDQNTLSIGDWNAICDVCGFKFKASDLKKRWDGYWVCKEDWETRHPSDFFRAPKDDQSVAWTRTDSEDAAVVVHGDVTAFYIYGIGENIHVWNTKLTEPRVFFIDSGTAMKGNRITVYKNAIGNTLRISAGVYDTTILEDVKAVIVIEFDGTIWKEVSYTTL